MAAEDGQAGEGSGQGRLGAEQPAQDFSVPIFVWVILGFALVMGVAIVMIIWAGGGGTPPPPDPSEEQEVVEEAPAEEPATAPSTSPQQ